MREREGWNRPVLRGVGREREVTKEMKMARAG